MKKTVTAIFVAITLCTLCATATVAATTKPKKEKPDLEEIGRKTTDPSSKFYFKKLRDKFNENDTLMTPEEFRYYYFGYMFQEDYDPYRESAYAESTDSLLAVARAKAAKNDSIIKARVSRKESPFEINHLYKEYKEREEREQREIIKKAELALKDNPFDLNTMWLYRLVARDMKKKMLSDILDFRFAHLIGAIVSTGTGLDKENAFYVTSPDHEYAVLEVMGYRPVAYDDAYFAEGYDYILVEPLDPSKKSASTPQGFFFNIKKPVEEYARKHPTIYDQTDGDNYDDGGEPIPME